ncbi:hypothetical protein Tco_0837939 [Tanacetum coccineum]
MDNALYADLLKRCFAREKKQIKVPRNLAYKQSTGCSSSSYSVARTRAVVQAPGPNETLQEDLASALAHLHNQHPLRLPASKLVRFSSSMQLNPVASRVFLCIDGHEERLDFIDELDPGLKRMNMNCGSIYILQGSELWETMACPVDWLARFRAVGDWLASVFLFVYVLRQF